MASGRLPPSSLCLVGYDLTGIWGKELVEDLCTARIDLRFGFKVVHARDLVRAVVPNLLQHGTQSSSEVVRRVRHTIPGADRSSVDTGEHFVERFGRDFDDEFGALCVVPFGDRLVTVPE